MCELQYKQKYHKNRANASAIVQAHAPIALNKITESILPQLNNLGINIENIIIKNRKK